MKGAAQRSSCPRSGGLSPPEPMASQSLVRPSSRALTRQQIKKRVDELGQWFHNIDLRGVRTAPNHFLGDYPNLKWRNFAHAVPEDLHGKSVLDIGCNAGFYSIEMKRRGADRVVGIDSNEYYLAQARFAAEVTG